MKQAKRPELERGIWRPKKKVGGFLGHSYLQSKQRREGRNEKMEPGWGRNRRVWVSIRSTMLVYKGAHSEEIKTLHME